MRRLDWSAYRAPEFEDVDSESVIAILPTAAVEQHGPHLPTGTDTMIAEGMLDELRRDCPDDLDIRILPVQAVGKSNEHVHAPGTLTLTAETALRAWTEIGLSVARARVRKIVIVNSHGGNLDLVSILSRELRVRAGMLAVKCQWGGFGAPEGLYSPREVAFGIHGGDRETSLMLHFRPETVDMEKARDFPSTAEIGHDPPDRTTVLRMDRIGPEPRRSGRRGTSCDRREGRRDVSSSGSRLHRSVAAGSRPPDRRDRAVPTRQSVGIDNAFLTIAPFPADM